MMPGMQLWNAANFTIKLLKWRILGTWAAIPVLPMSCWLLLPYHSHVFLAWIMKGEPVCNFYTMYGSCKYGSACKYDHPQMVGYYNYNYNYAMPALSIQDPSVMFPNQRSSQVTVTAPQRSPPKAEASDDDPADPSSQSSPSNNEPHSQSTQDQSDQN